MNGSTANLQQKLRQTLHVSWLLAALASGLLLGVALSVLRPIQNISQSPLMLITALALAGISLSIHRRSFVIIALCAGMLLGFWRGSTEQHALHAYRQYFDKTVIVSGKISDDVTHGDKGDVRMQLVQVKINGNPMHGKVWASASPSKQFSPKRSDTVILSGVIETGFGNIPASMSPATFVGLKPTNKQDHALQARDWFAGGIRHAIAEPAASLGAGFLTGQHSDLPGNLSDELKAVGLTHAVVASGSNLTILVGFTRRLFGKMSKFTATTAGAAMTVGFIMVTGLSPSMTRAGLVTGLSLAAWYYGRRLHPLVLLPFAAGITVMLNPSYIWGDIGWYLSFGSFAGVLILAPLIQHYFWGKDYKPNIVTEILIGTTAAQVATMPVILFSFGNYSSYALLANMLVLPLIPLAMCLTFVSGVVGVITSSSLATAVGWPAELVMTYMLRVIHWVANLPGAQGQITYGQLALIGSYGGMVAAILYMWRRTRHNFGNEAATVLLGERV